MPPSKRRQLIDAQLGELPIGSAFRDRLAAHEDLAPAEVERLARVAGAFSVSAPTQIEPMLRRAMAGSRRAMGMPTRPRTAPEPALYQPHWTNADRDLGQLAQCLAKRPEARLCLYGPSGTGKSAFAHYLSRVAERPLIAKRASDLLDCYVGSTEKQIAAAFDQARDQDAILLIDEADSFLMDRQRAQRNWELSQVNELLAQMENYDGLLVMTTNLFDKLDSAVIRRFDFKVKFDFLKPDQRCDLLAAFAERIPLVGNPLAKQAAEARLARLDRLTPGDYALVARQVRICGTMT
ncbi:MAG: AAA family ATPase, partial [Anaerolineae bacterium]|nr:AAA family ATPase [Anaerolineae bacterium]